MTLNLAEQLLRGSSGICLQPLAGRRGEEGEVQLLLPQWRRACYYAPYQKYDPIHPDRSLWPDGCNRIQPLVIESFEHLQPGGMFLLLELASGEYAALLPLAARRSLAWFAPNGGSLYLKVGTLGTDPVEAELEALVWACSEDPYTACREVWQTALRDSDGRAARMREHKAYPEPFMYLGWCSWEEFKMEISASLLLQTAEQIRQSDIPVGYMLIDDGHVDADDKKKLLSFMPHSDKFPAGWQALLPALRQTGLRWVGLWLNFNGYWNGIATDNRLESWNERLEPVADDTLQPRCSAEDADAYYDGWLDTVRQSGFDFIKVDNQARNVVHYRESGNAAEAAILNQQALEQAAERHMDGLINCMAHSTLCVQQSRFSAVTRCSEDYKAGDLARARRHLHNSYANMPWLGQTVWGDHDMFHSNDPVSGEVMAVSKAISGGPVLLSDRPEQFRPDLILPLCWSDGRLLRPLAPAAPVPCSLFLDPFASANAYEAIAPLPGGAAALAAYNLTEPVQAVSGSFDASVYLDASALLPTEERAEWTMPEDGLLVYDWARQSAQQLVDGDRHEYALPSFGHHYVHLVPIRMGWAVVGRTDKYLSPAAVEVLELSEDSITVRLQESGPFALWNADGEIVCDSDAVNSRDGGLWRFEFELSEQPLTVHFNKRNKGDFR